MSNKHLFDSAEGLVVKSLKGSVALNPALRLHVPSKSVYVHSRSPNTHVAVISGGGAGHEPAHASYTGRGMLSASVSGDIFASPSASQILTAIRFAAYSRISDSIHDPPSPTRDVLVIINNYTGDRLNFGLAIEKARAEGVKAESVVVADDVSLLGSAPTLVGPRGLAGNILVCKILGALAERGEHLDTVKSVGDVLLKNLGSIGVGLEHCHVPGRSKEASNSLQEGECEVGLGLHNEPGVKKQTLNGPAELVSQMVTRILNLRPDFVEEKDDIVLFVNNLGGMSQLEMGALLSEILDYLADIGIYPKRILSSAYMTSLNAPGFSLSILNVSGVRRSLGSDVEILRLLDEPTEALAWIGVRSYWPEHGTRYLAQENAESERQFLSSFRDRKNNLEHGAQSPVLAGNFWRKTDISPTAVKNGILGSCAAILRVEADLTHFDTVTGDGDCGATFAAGAKGVMEAIDHDQIDVGNLQASELVQLIGEILEAKMGGTMGALFAIFFTGFSTSLRNASSGADVIKAFNEALAVLATHTPARPGDRTIIDALQPFSLALTGGKGFSVAVLAANEGAKETKGMKAKLGRAVYVDTDEQDLPPDPGAVGVAALLDGFLRGFTVTEA